MLLVPVARVIGRSRYENDHVTLRIRIVAPTVQPSDHPDGKIRQHPRGALEALLGEVTPSTVEENEATYSAGSELARTDTAAARIKERLLPRRLTAPKVFGVARTEDEVRQIFRKSQRFLNLTADELNGGLSLPQHQAASKHSEQLQRATAEKNRARLVRDVLTELGHSPTEDDLEFALRRLREYAPAAGTPVNAVLAATTADGNCRCCPTPPHAIATLYRYLPPRT